MTLILFSGFFLEVGFWFVDCLVFLTRISVLYIFSSGFGLVWLE
ncbi:MAG: hypothetical protein FD143_2911 [Ignavibacteria bacterium]|nr:MAG: hypothetical protein FD143_2911 [Ignavibacteria bacterium]